jgi:hypothetical protein
LERELAPGATTVDRAGVASTEAAPSETEEAGADCCLCCGSADVRSAAGACWTITAGAGVRTTGAGFLRTSIMAVTDAINVAILMMRSSLSFMDDSMLSSPRPQRQMTKVTIPVMLLP